MATKALPKTNVILDMGDSETPFKIASEPFVGMGVTIPIGSASYAATVVEVGPKHLTVQKDTATPTHGSPKHVTVYDHHRDTDAPTEKFSLRADGSYKAVGANSGALILGQRITRR